MRILVRVRIDIGRWTNRFWRLLAFVEREME